MSSATRCALPRGEIHVWRFALDLPAPAVARLRDTLAVDEVARASRIRASRGRDRFIAAHGVLRQILGRYLGAAPGQLRFRAGPAGKPALASPGSSWLRFNLSHCQDLALCAVARGREIGVDVERVRGERDWEGMAARHLAAIERARLDRLPALERSAAFFACWTCKEAYCKATGAGLAQPLSRVAIDLRPGAPAALVVEGGERWSLRRLDPGPGFAAALVVEGQGWELRCRQWPALSA